MPSYMDGSKGLAQEHLWDQVVPAKYHNIYNKSFIGDSGQRCFIEGIMNYLGWFIFLKSLDD